MAKHLKCVHGMGDHKIGDEFNCSDAEAAHRLDLYSGMHKCYVLVKDLGTDEPAETEAPAPAPAPEAPAETPAATPEAPAPEPEAPAGRKAKRGE